MKEKAPVYREDLTVYEVTIETMEPTIFIFIFLSLEFLLSGILPGKNKKSWLGRS